MTIIDRVRTQSLGSLNFEPPVTSGLVGLFQPRRSDDVASANLVNSAAPGLAVGGGIIYGSWSASLGPGGYIETQLPETADFTLITVARKNTAGGVALVSTLAGAANSTPYAHQVFRLTNPSRLASNAKTTPVTAEGNLGFDFPAGDTGFEMFFTSCGAGSITNMMPRNPAGTVGGNPRVSALAGPRDVGSANWRIGSARVTTALYPNGTEIALVMIYNRALGELEGRAVYAKAKAYFAQRGIAI